MRHTTRSAVTLCAALGLTAAIGSATASAAPAASPSGARAVAPAAVRQTDAPVLVDCFWHPQVRPTDFILACGDGNSRLVSLHWDTWNADSARATGVNVVNDCDPYCAVGTFHPYAVVVKLDRPEAWKKDPRLQHYSRISLTYPGARPEQFGPVVTYPLWN
ncbi:hypothetical protein OG562_43120 [Streptomyces sp. NBC_01275]|uniref:hypothetical protein n=1 Tax=Streptomyces sp. NBC_01275 TaxID=2903807 RepID=UPI00225BFAA5|nr:hypothetical protein [Streptomyces sp. NBC_01275]MCX4767633.1 hypothetical protein [Streptomyces sp. NBC_01275]